MGYGEFYYLSCGELSFEIAYHTRAYISIGIAVFYIQKPHRVRKFH